MIRIATVLSYVEMIQKDITIFIYSEDYYSED